ncbi:hypothetical protein CJ030_MR1G001435 [Morella rubra]|uniref:Uncharacterized protein n=1 Tax=Morella rubra TaxID=262757 RepID=A0A6A1WMK7_9ROSI|nr:hypothetical protein CJ030_MR1G001435 [Morella rubra]
MAGREKLHSGSPAALLRLLLASSIISCFAIFAFRVPLLPQYEVEKMDGLRPTQQTDERMLSPATAPLLVQLCATLSACTLPFSLSLYLRDPMHTYLSSSFSLPQFGTVVEITEISVMRKRNFPDLDSELKILVLIDAKLLPAIFTGPIILAKNPCHCFLFFCFPTQM